MVVEKKSRLELSKRYRAIDGIPMPVVMYRPIYGDGKEHVSKPGKLAIRSDVEKILNFDDKTFSKWYTERKESAERLLRDYEMFGSIPNLSYGSEDARLNMRDSSSVMVGHISSLREGLDYLEIIKELREGSI